MELNEICVDWRGRPTSLFEGDGWISGAVGMCEPAIGAVSRSPWWSIFCFNRHCDNSQQIDRNIKIKADSRIVEIGFWKQNLPFPTNWRWRFKSACTRFCSDRSVGWMDGIFTESAQLKAKLSVRFHLLACRHEWEQVSVPIRRFTPHLYALSDHSIVIGLGATHKSHSCSFISCYLMNEMTPSVFLRKNGRRKKRETTLCPDVSHIRT
jgi:hypothetical protein